MEMQDNEFHELFRSKLDDFEMEPSSNVWESIDAELHHKSGKKTIVPILRIAASIIVLITAALLFIPKKKAVEDAHPRKNNVVANNSTTNIVKHSASTSIKAVETKQQVAGLQVPVKRSASVNNYKQVVPPRTIPSQNEDKPITKNELPVEREQPELLAMSTERMKDISTSIPNLQTPLVDKQLENETPVLVSTGVAVSKESKVVRKKRGIRSFGDIVNVVVAKLDKRKDKIIEFADTDDEGSHIAAINLSAFKTNKDK